MTQRPAADGFRMPPEWAPHTRTWMAMPSPSTTFADDEDLDVSRRAWAEVARTISRFEPVTMLTTPGDGDAARTLLGPGVDVVEQPLNDAWIRDMGPTFLVGNGELAAADWVFNGWGAQDWAQWDLDSQVGAKVAELAGARSYTSRLVNEGGGIHIDGEGTVLLTETVQLDPGRNPGWTREQVEEELHAFLGTSKAIWLPRGLTADYGRFGTRGHVDILAAFVRPGTVVVHSQQDPSHPDYEVSQQTVKLLAASTDARGRTLEVVELPAPTVTEEDGELVDYSYVNHYLCNGAVVLCSFDDPADRVNAEIFGRLFPEREVVLVDARTIFAHGGGIHCITQQQPQV
ncbi:agmatine deiminase family protein [Streptomyces sp. H10-C2]|uniref:agmatine deiminase family protein n=1 Tax=unclassified Streptomyces TaxID=2593676 RepID=UPI0024BB302B|nr:MULTISPECIES: agmatine deiminase family protein [unclassified Streptomyces]MDJ0341651.1 agmatine deiminase family protein [Streptomyces sp. PH10-H1]MDJ0369041.1 agmatine deiminase family protein [Streptomyces sp. H10-C2]